MNRHLPWLTGELDRLHSLGLVRQRRQVVSLPDGWIEIDGRRLRDFSANDYLNLAHDPRLAQAAAGVLESAGTGARASALVTGRTEWHVRLERRIAEFEEQPDALVFPTGYAANLGTISALAGPDDAVFCDRLNHASLIDGCRLSRARLRIYRHDDLDALRRRLDKASHYRRRLIVTDGVFSMDGHLAPLEELCDICERYDAPLVVDEAHGTGVFGEHGRGAAELLGLEDRITVRIGTLSKALGTLGGFVAGQRELVDWLWNRARTQVFSTALPPAVCAAAAVALDIVEQEPWRREQLLARSGLLRRLLHDYEIDTPQAAIGPIVPVLLGEPSQAVSAAGELEQRGFAVAAIRPPTVPEGTSRLRITLSCAHTEDDVRELAAAVAVATKALPNL
jgi:8-amino-7-oxononanoate synthase